MENTKKTVWVLFEDYHDDHENHINTFSTYEKGKEQFDKLMKIWEQEGYFNDMENWKDYERTEDYCCMFDTGTEAELFESELNWLNLKID